MKEKTAQQLLTGQKRLAGFSETWESKRIGQLIVFRKGKTLPREFQGGDYPLMAAGMEYAGTSTVPNRHDKVVSISSSGASAGYIKYHSHPIWASDCFTFGQEDLNGLDFSFAFYLLKSKQNDIYGLQSGGAQPHVYPRDLNMIVAHFPRSIVEQQAIARVLSDVDAEIATLEAKLCKVRDIKIGMMQELLTGHTRLSLDEETCDE